MGAKLSRFLRQQKKTTAAHAKVLEITVQPGPSRPCSGNSKGNTFDPPPIDYSSSSSLSSLSDCNIKQRFSIISITSTDSESGDSANNKEKKRALKKEELLKPGEAVPLTDISAIDADKDKEKLESESDRLFREEQERLEKEKRQERAKSARLKRRSQLYGGAEASLSQGTSGVQPAERVLRLISSSGNSRPNLLPTAPRNLQKQVPSPSSNTSTFCSKPNHIREKSVTNKKLALTLPGTPLPGTHKGISRIIESEYDSVSRSGQYVRNLGKRSYEGVNQKLSPLVSNKELFERTILKRSSKGLPGQTQAWRLVQLRTSNSKTVTKDSIQKPKHNNTSTPKGVLPHCPPSNTKARILLEGNLTMNNIEKFLETRDHIDKTEFDMVVRNLIEEDHVTGSQTKKAGTKTNALSQPTESLPQAVKTSVLKPTRSKPQPVTTSLPDFPIQPKVNNNERVFVAGPYHPGQSKFYGKNKFFEPAAYVHLPSVTGSSNKGSIVSNEENKELNNNRTGRQQKQHFDGSKSSVKSEKIDKYRKEKPSAWHSKENINAESLISSFNGTRTKPLQGHEKAFPVEDIPLASVKGLPPVSTVPLVTRACVDGDNRPKNVGSLRYASNETRQHQHQYDRRSYHANPCTSDHAANELECKKCCGRPPSRGGRALMEWLHSKRRFSY